MIYIVKIIVFVVVLFLVFNDFLFNRLRNKLLKVAEFLLCIAMIYSIFVNVSAYIAEREGAIDSIKEMGHFGSSLTVYSVDGKTKTETTVGDFLYTTFVHNVFDGNTGISATEFLKNNLVIIVVSVILLVYWILLLMLFEKEEVINYKIEEDEKLFEKYNPLVAACVAQNRNIMCRDIVGVILNLIDKGKINLRMVPVEKSPKSVYKYMISENHEKDIKLDMIEKEIYEWIFEEVPKFRKGIKNVDYISVNQEGIIEIDLNKRFKELAENSDTYARLKHLNLNVKKRLNYMGANKEAVPWIVKLLNNYLIVLSLFLVTNNIMQNGMDITVNSLQVLYVMFILIFAITILPVIYIVSLVIMEFIRNGIKVMQQITEGHTGRKLIAKAVSIVSSTFVIMIIYALLAKDLYVIFDILLLGITCLIIFTDDYMLKHDYKILNDYYNLKRIENKIEEYSMMELENIEYIEVWDKYYAYSVALGIPTKVNKSLEVSYETPNIVTSQNLEAVYYVCKSYLEVMWDMEFYDKKSKIDIRKIF